MTWPTGKAAAHPALTLAWVASCVGGAIFPLLSVNKEESIPLMYVLSRQMK
jgi:hypothetical protein